MCAVLKTACSCARLAVIVGMRADCCQGPPLSHNGSQAPNSVNEGYVCEGGERRALVWCWSTQSGSVCRDDNHAILAARRSSALALVQATCSGLRLSIRSGLQTTPLSKSGARGRGADVGPSLTVAKHHQLAVIEMTEDLWQR